MVEVTAVGALERMLLLLIAANHVRGGARRLAREHLGE
jgi:hypothetical protein